jgi:hypothetical protein
MEPLDNSELSHKARIARRQTYGPTAFEAAQLSRNLAFTDSRSLGNNQFEAKLLCPFGQ